MLKKIKKYTLTWNSNDWILSYLLFVSFFNVKFAPIGIIALLINSMFFNRKKDLKPQLIFNVEQPFSWMLFFYCYHLIGLIWSSNFSFAWADIGMKASFILFPLIFLTGEFNLTKTSFLQLIVVFLTTNVALLLFFAVFKSIYYEEDNHWNYFFESEFSCLMHRSYFATYTAIGAVIAFYKVLTSEQIKWNIFATILLFTATILTLSKAGLIVLICSFMLISFWMLMKQKNWKVSVFIIAILLLLVLFFSISNSSISSRVQEIPKALRSIQTENNQSTESNAARIIMWSTAFKIIKEHPILGVGTGDVKDELIKKNRELNNLGVANSKLNSHNQYLNSWVQLGVFGLIFLIGIFFTAFKLAWKNKNLMQFFILFIFVISLLFESFLETQAGIIPFCLLVSLTSSLKMD